MHQGYPGGARPPSITINFTGKEKIGNSGLRMRVDIFPHQFLKVL